MLILLRGLALAAVLAPSVAAAVSPNIVVSQVYGGAGCGTAGCSTYKNDYIELFNRGNTPVSVNGWSVQYAAATGTAWQVTNLPNVSIPAGAYLLVAQGAGANGVNNLPTPDVTGTIAMSATAAKIALVNTTTALTGACPTGATIVDLVGVGLTANCNEGGANAPAPSTTTADIRAVHGCTDTDNNGSDFSAGAPTPRNSATAASPCTPANNLSINDVTLNEGNAGTTNFTFTVSLTAPAGPGGVTFDIATADGTAAAPGDYTAKSLTAQTIPAGASTYSFTVLANGDTSPETNETFFVNVTNVTGATVTDGQGQGTIVNDDAAPNLTINDVSHAEGNAGTTTYTFTVSLSAPAPAGGVVFDIATANGTAVAPGDYTAKSLTGQTIPAGSSTYTFDVLVNGDVTPESDETFDVNVTNLVNAIGTDTQGQGTIANDDLSKIHDVQGNGAATPIPGATVTVEGVVIGNFQGTARLQGFFLQEEDADADADPATSEGIFVFCSTCPTAVAEGQRVRATGVVSEFNNFTEITASTAGSVIVTNAGNNLAQVTPTPIVLPVVGDIDTYYESRESMRVTFVDTLTVSDYFELPRYGQIVLMQGGRPRSFTEAAPPSAAGYAAHLDELTRRRVILDDDNNIEESYLAQPGGSQFVFHPRANGGFSVGTQGTDFFRGGDLVNGLTGVLDFSAPSGTATASWRVRPTAATPATFTVANPRPVTPPVVGGAIKVAGANLLNYFTTIDTTASSSSGPCGPGGTLDCRGADSVAELNRQRDRAATVACALNADLIGYAELENTTPSATITDLLGAINTRCGGAHPYAFANTGGTLGTDAIRVQIVYRTGVVSPVGSPLSDLDPIHNRPPTAQAFDVVDAINPAFGRRFVVVVNHLRAKGCSGSATGADADQNDGQSCFNAQRTAQANRTLAWLAGTVIPAAGTPNVLMLGDFNSYAQEDPVTAIEAGGYSDLETQFHGANAYSYVFSGELGHLDYAFASSSLVPDVTGAATWHINADEVPLFDYNDEVADVGEQFFEEKPDGSALVPPRVVFQPGTPYRASDHDPVLVGLFQISDLAITITDTPDPMTAGTNLTYAITATNNGPDAATNAAWTTTLPAGASFVSMPAVAGWSCTTPLVGTNGTVTCTAATLAVGSSSFTLVILTDPSDAAGSVLSETVTITSNSGDPDTANNAATATTTVATSADLSIANTAPSTATSGQTIEYTIVLTNAGPSTAANVSLVDTLPANTTFAALTSPVWSCTTPAVGATGTVSCSGPTLLPGDSLFFTLTVTVDAAATGTIDNTATVSAATTDPTPGNNSATASTTLGASADLGVTNNASAASVLVGQNISYTIDVTNGGPSAAANAALANAIPANTTFVSLSSPGGWSCTTPAVGATGNVNCSTPSLAPGASAAFTLTVAVDPSAPATTISDTAAVSSTTTDPTPGNGSATATTTVTTSADLTVTNTASTPTAVNGEPIGYTIVLTNAGPSSAADITVTDAIPTHTTFASLSSPPGWSCTTPAVGATGTVVCTASGLAAGGSVTFVLTVTVDAAAPPTTIGNTVSVTSSTSDPTPVNNSASTSTTTPVSLQSFGVD